MPSSSVVCTYTQSMPWTRKKEFSDGDLPTLPRPTGALAGLQLTALPARYEKQHADLVARRARVPSACM